VWAWQEVGFLLGYVTGPRRQPCPPGARGWQRTGYAVQAVLHHELALVVLCACVAAATWDAANQTGWWIFIVLWVMRQSAKLNVFLGVRNLNESFLPVHLKYMQTYFQRRPMNVLFPFSVTVATALVGAMLVLAIIEHGFMVLPLPSEALWKWGMGSRK
jgi:putative photosynthetic complex assembly protein 2